MHNISNIFPDAIVQELPYYNNDFFCYYDESSKQYFAIPKTSITDREKLLLDSMYPLIETTPDYLNQSRLQKAWFDFLIKNGSIPSFNGRIRFIYFRLNELQSHYDFMEAVHSFFSDQTIFIWIDQKTGVIIENETVDIVNANDLYSFYDAILSDFYIKVDFYIGRFFDSSPNLRNQFLREQYYFKISMSVYPQNHVFNFINAFPLVMMTTEWNQLTSILHQEYQEIFQHDSELINIIKTYLENNSNTSLTAKKLYMHRNSLQYKIDKFIEQTSIDIKSFHGAISIYFICLYGEVSTYVNNDTR